MTNQSSDQDRSSDFDRSQPGIWGKVESPDAVPLHGCLQEHSQFFPLLYPWNWLCTSFSRGGDYFSTSWLWVWSVTCFGACTIGNKVQTKTDMWWHNAACPLLLLESWDCHEKTPFFAIIKYLDNSSNHSMCLPNILIPMKMHSLSQKGRLEDSLVRASPSAWCLFLVSCRHNPI